MMMNSVILIIHVLLFLIILKKKASLDELHRGTDSSWLRAVCANIPEFGDAVEDDQKDFVNRADAYFRPFKSKFFSSLRECVNSVHHDKDTINNREAQKQKLFGISCCFHFLHFYMFQFYFYIKIYIFLMVCCYYYYYYFHALNLSLPFEWYEI